MFFCLGFYNKIPHIGCLKKQKFIFLQSGGGHSQLTVQQGSDADEGFLACGWPGSDCVPTRPFHGVRTQGESVRFVGSLLIWTLTL